MPIAKGEAWGTAGSLPAGSPVVETDAAVAALLGATPLAEWPVVVGVAGGDLARTLGVRSPYRADQTNQLLPVDALTISLDGDRSTFAVAHVVFGHPLWDRHVVVVMNAAFIGKRNVAPRSHPGDGKADVLTFELDLADRIKAVRRMPAGSHLPHPGIRTKRRASGAIELDRQRPVWIDGQRVGSSSSLRFEVLADALVVAV